MKVVLFCGGFGMRMREYSETLPKPLVMLGTRPILWHLMKYYAHYGHRDFIICLGYKGHAIKDYFLNYNECVSNDFVLSQGGNRIELLNRDLDNWRITFVETGSASNIGERLMAIRPFLDGEEAFLANYADGLTDCPLPTLIDTFHATNSVATFMIARPNSSFHFVWCEDRQVTGIRDVEESGLWINAGFFVLRHSIFDYIKAGEELVSEPFQRLIAHRRLNAVPYTGFWRAVDTFKDLQALQNLLNGGVAPWQVWRKPVIGDDGDGADMSAALMPSVVSAGSRSC